MGVLQLLTTGRWESAPGGPVDAAAAPSVSGGLGTYTWDPLMGSVSRTLAMSLPTVGRARDVLAGALSQVPLRAYLFDRITGTYSQHPAPPTWLDRPDPDRTRGALIADVLDDLVFQGQAYLHVRHRDAAGFPDQFRVLPVENLGATMSADGLTVTAYTWGTLTIPARDVVRIESVQSAALQHGWGAIETAQRLEDAAQRFASTEVPAGWLQQTGGIPLTPAEQRAMGDTFAKARHTNTVAVLSEHVTWHESSYDPSRLQLTEARQHAATDLARVMNVPAAIVHAPSNDSLTYANAQDQRSDLWTFGLAPIAHAIASTLSGPNVTPRGTVVRFDPSDTLADPFPTEGSQTNDAAATSDPEQ